MKIKKESEILSKKIEVAEKRKKKLLAFLNSKKIEKVNDKMQSQMIEADREIGNVEAYLKGILEAKKSIKKLRIYLCAKLEGECLLKKKDIRKIYNKMDELFGK